MPYSSLNDLAASIHETAKRKGWWPGDEKRNFGELIALVHSELSEALEAYRTDEPLFHVPKRFAYMGKPQTQDSLKPEGVGVELVDAVIRILDILAWHGADIDHIMDVKLAYNKTRPHRHGGLRA